VTQLNRQHQQLGRQNRIPQCRLVVYSSEHVNEALLAKAAAATLGGSAGLPLEVTRRIVTERGKGRTFQASSLARRTVKEQSSTTFMEPTVLPIGHGSEIPVQRLPSRPWRLATRRGPTPDGCGAGRGRRLSCSIVCSVRTIGSFVSPPATFRLGEPIRDDVEGFKIVAVSEVAAVHVNVLRARRRKAGAALPGHDAVGFAVDARGGEAQWVLPTDTGGLGNNFRGVGAPVDQVPHAPSVTGLVITAERGAKSDDRPDVIGKLPRQLARIDAARTPADDAHPLPAAAGSQLVKTRRQFVFHAGPVPKVVPLPPVVGPIPELTQDMAEESSGFCARQKPRNHQNRVSIAVGPALDEVTGQSCTQIFHDGAPFA